MKRILRNPLFWLCLGVFAAASVPAVAGVARVMRGETLLDRANATELYIDNNQVTATAAEINAGVDGLTATAAEINAGVDGLTATSTELNQIDGVAAGTVTASKVLIVDATKTLDTLDISTGGLKVGGSLLVLPFTLFLEDACGNDSGVDSDGVLIGDLTESVVQTCTSADAGVFTADTTDCNDVGANDVQVWPTTPAVNDAFYFGASSTFSHIRIDIGTQGSTVLTVVWEYATATTTWTTLTFGAQGVADFDESAGVYYNTFEPPSDWVQNAVDGETMYWVRARVSAYTSTATAALLDEVDLGLVDAGTGINMPNDGTLIAGSWSARTNSATNNNTTLLLMNVTQGTHVLMTMTKGVDVGRSNFTDLSITAGDDLVVQNLGEDGSTEFADVNIVLEYAL